MDEKYIKDLWDWTTSQDPTFTDRYTFESWKEKLGTDNEYQEKFHSWVSSQDNTFAQRRPLEQWKELVKKKEQTIQPSVQSGSTDLSSEDGSSVSAESLKKQQKDREDREAMLAKINAPMSEEEYTTRLGETIEEDTKRKQLEQWEKEREVRELKEKEFERKFIRDPETGVYRKRTLQEAAEVARDYRTDEYQDEAAKALELIPGGKRDIDMNVDGYQAQQIQDYLKTQENIEEELPALQAKQNAEAAAKSEMKDIEEQVRLGNIEDEGFQFALSTIEPQLIDKDPKVVIDKLRKQFDGYGFVFQDANVGNLMVVAAPNGNTTLVHLDPWLSSTEIAESKKLRDFMVVNSTHKPADAPTGLVINSMRAKQLRDVARDNGDGSESTVLFTSYEQDGKYKVIPTLFPKDPETYTAKPADWMEPTFEEAMEIAEKRGEVFVFNTEEEAEDFAQGNWKDVSTHEAEALDFYRKRGMDYESEKQVYDKYMDATDIMFFLDPDRDGSANLFGEGRAPFNQESLTEEQVEMLGNNVDKLYIDGKLRQDAQQLLKDAEKVADRLSPAFLAEEAQLAREEFDLYLNKRHQAEIPKAIEMVTQVKQIEKSIVEDALENFNLRPEELVGIDFEDPIKNEKARLLSQAFEEAQVYKSIAADKYYNGNTYYDMKHNKAATKEYADNWESFTTEIEGGYSRGKAGDVILAGAFYPEILGGFDLDDPESTQKMAEKLVMYLQQEPEKISRVMSRYSQARTSSEIANVILSDPLEWATSLAAGSLSQMAPYGMKIVSASVSTGAGTGAIAGSIVPGAGTLAGAGTGAVWGFRTGMAATSLAMEYTNEMIEAIREFCEENGSTVNDAEMVAVALQTQSVWDKGRERGLKRGIPIAMVDMLTSSLAGRLLVPSKLAGKGSRIAAMTAERLALDPFFEGVGEYAAQVTVGDDIDWKEIYAEAGGAVGNNTSNMSINLLRQTKRTSNIEKAAELTRINDIINESASDSRISEWGNNMERLGQISPEENKRIQDNVGLRKTANELLNTGRIERRLQGKKDKALTERVMQLLSAKAELSSTTNRKELFGKKIGEINDELNDIITTKKLKPKDKQTMLEGTGVLFSGEQASTADIREAMPTYKLKTNKFKRARQVTKQEMLNYIESSTPEKLNNTPLIKVSNDSDVNNALVKKMMQGKLEDKLAETQAEVADAESISVVEGEVDVDATETVAEEVVSSKTLAEEVTEIAPEEVTEDVAEEVTPTTEEAVDAVLSEQEAKDLEAFLDNQSDPQFQLSSDETSPKRKQKLEKAATELMNEVQPEIVEESFTVEEPAVKPIPVNITENKELSDKVPKIKLKDLVKSKINLVMADQLKVFKDLMGGHFFPLMKDTFGKVAWASIDLEAARAIVRGSIKSDKSVVFNMNPTAVDSNLAVIDAFVSDIQKASNPDKIFTEMISYLQTVKHGKKTEEVHNMARDSKNLAEFVDAFSELDVDTKAAIVKKVIPKKDINPSLDIGKILKEQGITQEKIRDEISEQFAKDLPMGAMTMVLEITDADGNPITKEADIDKAIMTQEQQDAEGIRRHRNYPVYIRGRAVAMLEETVPFWKISKEATNTIDKKLARVIQPKEKYTVDINGSERIVKVSTSKGARTIQLMKKGTTDKVESESTLPKSNKKATAKIIESKYGKITKTEGVGETYTESASERAEYRRAQMQANKSFEVQEARENTYRRFINRLTKAFPSVEVLASKEEFDNLVENLAAKKLSTKTGKVGGQKIYGAVLDGKLYLNPSLSNFNTPVHEFGHIWMNVSKEINPEAYKSGLNLIKDSEYVSQVENNAAYQKVIKQMKKDGATEEDIRNYILEEALATAIGDKGESFVNAAQKRNFKNWLNELFEFVKKLTGISKMTPEQIQDLSLDEFLNSVVVDLMSENKLFKDAEVKNLSNELQLMTASPNPSIDNIVSTARANGFSDASIRVVLKDRGFKAADIKEAMTVQIDLVTEMPSEFGNVEGGAIVGQKLFNEVRDAVNAFAIEGPRGGVGTAGVRTKTFAEVRGKAIEIMKDNKVFEAQNDKTQMELLKAFDRALGIRSNPMVRQQIADIRAKLKQRKKEATNINDAQRAMRMRIRQLLPKSEYTSTVLNKMLKVINETTTKNFDGQMTRVLDEVEKQRTKIRNQVILDIQKLVAKKAKTKKTPSGKTRSAGLDAIGQSYFAEVKNVLRAAIKQDTDAMIALQESVDEFVFSEGMETKKEGGNLTRKQQQMIDRQIALDTFSNVLTMNLEDVVTLFNEVKETRGESIARLKSNREVRRMMTERIKDDFNNQLKKDFKELYSEDGVALERPQLKKRRESIRSAFRNNGVWTGLSKWSKQFLPEGRKYKVNDLTKFFYNNLAHLGTITNILDRGKKGMFTKVFYDNLNDMDENNLKGVRKVTDKMNAITQSVVGKNWMDWKYSLGSDTETLTGFKSTLENLSDEPEFNKDQAMRVIALSLNADQKKKLIEQGLTDAKLEQLKTFVGEDQVKIIEQVVDFLSTTYFEQTNAVYSRVNDVNLGFVENYFPTQTLSQAEITADAVTGTEIQKIFNAEFSPALKERTDRTSDVVLDLSFTDVMEEHTKQMERYKAYAVGVKEINSVLKDRGIQNILNETGVKKVFDIALNYAINPDAGPSVDPTIIDKLQRKYTGFALAFKLIQIPKQATSFVQAYDSYAGGKTKVPGYKLLSFMFDYAKVLVMLRSEIKEAREISATFDNRIKQGLEGDVFGLESGTRTFKKGTAQQGKRGKLKRGFRKAGGLPTVAGDILGVLGYKAVYNKAIRDGKSKAEALRMFNDYNATQQSRRATEKNQLQQSNDWKARFFTMFGSTVFLQQNKVYQSLNNLLKLKKPSSKDVKTFALNYAVANVLFTMAAYSASLISGNSDDRDRAYKAMLDAAKGKNLLFQIPMLGAALEGMNNKITGDRKPISEGVNPFMILPSKVMKAYDGLNPESIVKTATPFLEIMLGAQLDAPIALAKLMGGDASEENVLTTLGVSKSYRPGYGQKESKTTKKKEQTEAQMKKALKLNNEETYNKRYGPGTQSYKREQKMKERKKEMRERTRARRR